MIVDLQSADTSEGVVEASNKELKILQNAEAVTERNDGIARNGTTNVIDATEAMGRIT